MKIKGTAIDMDEPHPCPSCGGDGFLLGVLGNLVWFRCRHCGSDFKGA